METQVKILSAKIDWMSQFANLPVLKVYVDILHNKADFRYKHIEIGNGCSYWAQLDQEVNFFHHNYGNNRGYGGAVFNFTLENGEKRSVKGPWSSNSMWMNANFPPCHEVIYYQKDSKYPELGYAGYLTALEFFTLVEECGAEIAVINNYGCRPDSEIIGNLYATVIDKASKGEVIGEYSFAIKQKGMSLNQSQANKLGEVLKW